LHFASRLLIYVCTATAASSCASTNKNFFYLIERAQLITVFLFIK